MITVERIEDWRGEAVIDADGEHLGKLEELYFDARRGEPLLAAIKPGMLSRHQRVAPVEGARVSRGYLRLAHRRAEIERGAEIGGADDIDAGMLERIESVFGVTFPDELELWSGTEIAARRAEAEEARRRADGLEREAQARLAEHESAKSQAEGAASGAEAAERAAAEARAAAIEARRHAENFGDV
jgi:hypothetical protein